MVLECDFFFGEINCYQVAIFDSRRFLETLFSKVLAIIEHASTFGITNWIEENPSNVRQDKCVENDDLGLLMKTSDCKRNKLSHEKIVPKSLCLLLLDVVTFSESMWSSENWGVMLLRLNHLKNINSGGQIRKKMR